MFTTPAEAENYVRDISQELKDSGFEDHSILLPLSPRKRRFVSTSVSVMQDRLEYALGARVNRSFVKQLLEYQEILDPSSGQKMDIEALHGQTVLGDASKNHGLKLSLMVTSEDVFLWWSKTSE